MVHLCDAQVERKSLKRNVPAFEERFTHNATFTQQTCEIPGGLFETMEDEHLTMEHGSQVMIGLLRIIKNCPQKMRSLVSGSLAIGRLTQSNDLSAREEQKGWK